MRRKHYVICVTGVAGFIGQHFLEYLLEEGNCNVYGIDNLSYASRSFPSLEKWGKKADYVRFIQADIATIDKLPDCDFLVNFAAETHVDNSIECSDAFMHSNVEGVHNLLKLVAQKPIQDRPRFIQISTDEVYGDILGLGKHTETDPLKPSNPYSASKAAGDLLVMAWARTHGIKYNIIRPTNNYGKGQHPEKLIPKVIQYYRLGKKIPLHDNGIPIRNWLYVKDTADAIWKVMMEGKVNEIYNIPGNWECSNAYLVGEILSIMVGKEVNLEDYVDYSYERPGQDLRYSLSGEKIEGLKWKPIVNPRIILEDMIAASKDKFQWSV